jgi:hypothetical protein
VIVCFVDIDGIVDHHCLEVIFNQYQQSKQSPLNSDGQQFRLRKSLNPTRPWSQVDGVLWLRFIAKGASGIQNVNSYNNPQQRKCYERPLSTLMQFCISLGTVKLFLSKRVKSI